MIARWTLMLCLIALGSGRADAALRAWLDRSEIALGETVTLNIEVQGASVDSPDFSPLDIDFERSGSSSSTQMSLSAGQRSVVTRFGVSLRPRREGSVQVPPIKVDAQWTPALSLEVGPSPIDTDSGGDVFLEASVDKAELYVQEQAIYSVKLFHAVDLWDGQLEAPAADGLQSHRLGEDRQYQVDRGGRRYSVIERRFALVAERSGPLEIEAARFDGTGLDGRGYGGLLGSSGIRLSARGKPITLQVRPRPPAAQLPWLPAQSLEITQAGAGLPEEIAVGEPLKLELTVNARGLLPAQLPELDLPQIDGAAIYPDQASTRDRSDADGLAAERTRSFAIVPQRVGELRIPAIELHWWDVVADVPRVARLPPHVVRVLPAAGAGAIADAAPGTPPQSSAPAAEAPLHGQAGPGASQLDQRLGPTWIWAALSLVLGLGWWRSAQRRHAPPPRPVSPPAPRRVPPADLAQALAKGDPAAISAALRAAHPQGAVASLQAVALALEDPLQRDAVIALERHLFAKGSATDAQIGRQLGEAFRRGPRWTRSAPAAPAPDSGFPPLYG